MDSFVSTTRNAVDWLLRKPERSMHKVAEWLKENDLGQYIAKFEEYGWDELSVLSDMTLGDIAMCIQKPGHKAKFKRALRSFRCKQERAKTAMTEEYAPISGIITFDEEKEDTTEPIPETGYLDKQYDIDDIDVESDSESEQESFFDFKEPLTGDFQSTNEPALATSNALFIDENEEEDVEKSPVPLAGVEDYHTTYNAIEPDMCNEECLMAEQEVFEYAISIPGVSCNVNNVVAEIDML